MTGQALRLVLVTPEIPANTGNVMRLCAATGVPLYLVEPLGFTLEHKELRRAAMDYRQGCHFTCHLTFEELERAHPEAGFWFFSARAEPSFFAQRVREGDFLVFGPEARGLGKRFLSVGRRQERAVRLPMPAGGRSLNLATAAGIAVYEALRQLGRLEGRGAGEGADHA
ncbi:MAG: tRNA (cytidine(34)-2'-O)-methyltransferase [Myxococcales bacterium]|nr:tRNA (cytidine(34)-2'-O)-methyltransferase [Myxococcales bacterium]